MVIFDLDSQMLNINKLAFMEISIFNFYSKTFLIIDWSLIAEEILLVCLSNKTKNTNKVGMMNT
jgi:hypothetical protein